MIRLAPLRWPTCTPSRSLGLQENHVRGRPENPARTLGCEGPKSAGFSAHPVRSEALAGQPCGAMCEDFVRILAMAGYRALEARHWRWAPFADGRATGERGDGVDDRCDR